MRWSKLLLSMAIAWSCVTAALAFSAQPPAAGGANPLKSLDVLVGDWVSESKTPDGKMVVRTITYRWIFDQKYLQAESQRTIGDVSLRMNIVYLWDAAARTIRAWVIGSDGSWSQAEVQVVEGTVRLDSKGVNPDGSTMSLISTLQPSGEGTRTETWTGIKVGDKLLPDAPAILWRRK